MTQVNQPLRLNVGFFLNQSVGYSRDFPFELEHFHLEPDLEVDSLEGQAHITRTAQGILLQVKLQAHTGGACARCLDEVRLSLKSNFTELYAFTRATLTDSGLLLPDDHIIDLAPLVREYLLLELPINPLCKPDCKGLCPICGNNLNENTCQHDDDDSDPRLSVLKSLLDQS